MTCIVGLKDKKNDCVWMGCDSSSVSYFEHTIVPESYKKINRAVYNKNVLYGVCGSFRMIDILKYDEKLISKIESYDNIKIDHKYMVTNFIPRLQEALKNEPDSEFFYKGEGVYLLVGTNEDLFFVQNDYAVIPREEYASVGSGQFAAHGSLNATKELEMSPQKRVELALRAAIKEANGVEYPIYIMNTKNDEIIKVEK